MFFTREIQNYEGRQNRDQMGLGLQSCFPFPLVLLKASLFFQA